MDLLGRKARAQMVEMEGRQRLLSMRNSAYRTAFLHSAARAETLDGLVDSLLEENKSLIVALLRAEATIQQYTAPRPMIATKLYDSEGEEDLKWQLDQGIIERGQYEALLAELGFENTEIEIYESPDGNFTY